MALTNPSMCLACKHLRHSPWGFNTDERPTCIAYPDGIPDTYWIGGVAHTDPDGNDRGVQFELNPAKAGTLEAYIRYWYTPDDQSHPDISGESRLEIDL